SISPVHISGILVSARIGRVPSHGIERRLTSVEVTLRYELCTADYGFCRSIPAHLLFVACSCQYCVMLICSNPVHIIIFFTVSRDVSIGIKSDTLSKCAGAVTRFM